MKNDLVEGHLHNEFETSERTSTMKSHPQPRLYPPLKLAFCGEGHAAFTWWAPLLLQSPAFQVLAIWSPRKAEALSLAAAVTQNPSSAHAAEAASTATREAEPTGEKEEGARRERREACSTATNGVPKEKEKDKEKENEDVVGVGVTPAAAALRREDEKEEVEAYWEESGDISDIGSKNSKKLTRKNFSMLLHQQSERIDGFFLVLPPDAHAATAQQILSLFPQKHIFSATPPSLHSPTLKNLICQYTINRKANALGKGVSDIAATQKGSNSNNNRTKGSSNNRNVTGGSSSNSSNSSNSNSSRGRNGCTVGDGTDSVNIISNRRRVGVWSVCSPFRYEVAVTKLQALLKDLGKIVAAELLASAVTPTLAHTYTGALLQKVSQMSQQQQQASLLAVCCAYSSLLRLVLGDIVSLASIQGSNCFGKLCWNQERNAFEIQRYLHHYEHPTLHPITGPTWAVKTWVENVWRQERRENEARMSVGDGGESNKQNEQETADDEEKEEDLQAPERYLVDLLTSCALTDASGAVVQLR